MNDLPTVAEALDSDDDSALVSCVWKRIFAHYGNDLDISEIPSPFANVVLVDFTVGVVGNGGFNYLFEHQFQGDPQFLFVSAAFKDIGAHQAASIVDEVMSVFPNSVAPSDRTERLRIYRSSQTVSSELDKKFWKCKDEIEAALSSYIRSKADAFLALDEPIEPRAESETETPRAPVHNPADESATTIHCWERIPHWARIQVGARLLRRVLPVFDSNWPGASSERRQPLIDIMTIAESSAAQARPDPRLNELTTLATMTAGAALQSLYGAPDDLRDAEVFPPNGDCAVKASMIASAAQFLAEAALATPNESADAFTEFVNRGVPDEFADVLGMRLALDVDLMEHAAAIHDWTNSTPVGPERFRVFDQYIARKSRPWWKLWHRDDPLKPLDFLPFKTSE